MMGRALLIGIALAVMFLLIDLGCTRLANGEVDEADQEETLAMDDLTAAKTTGTASIWFDSQQPEGALATCPVSGREIVINKNTPSTVYQDKFLYFTSNSARKLFRTEPETYLSNWAVVTKEEIVREEAFVEEEEVEAIKESETEKAEEEKPRKDWSPESEVEPNQEVDPERETDPETLPDPGKVESPKE